MSKSKIIICLGLVLMFGQFIVNIIIGYPLKLISGCDYNPEIGGSCLYGQIDVTVIFDLLYALMWTGLVTFPAGLLILVIGVIVYLFKK